MQVYKLSLQLQSPLVTPLKGDTLFGQFCWAYRELYGEPELVQLLANYLQKPAVIFSDAFESGYLPRPSYPFAQLENLITEEQKINLIKKRKALKKSQWIKADVLFQQQKSLSDIMLGMLDDSEDYLASSFHSKKSINAHNTINRETGTTGDGVFAPYAVTATNYEPSNSFDIYVLLDTSFSLSILEIEKCLNHIGLFGFGADATIGMGKFKLVNKAIEIKLNQSNNASYYMNLSPTVLLDNKNVDLSESFYNVFTRFGRMGNIGSFSSNPFKQPVVTIDCGSLLKLCHGNIQYVGNGINGVVKHDNSVVYQGYAIVLPVLI